MTSSDPSDVSRLKSADTVDLQAIEQLFREHLNPLTRFVYSYVKSWEAAEDIVHDVFFQLWLRHRNLEPVRDLAAYLYTIARYDALDYLRHQNIEVRHRHEVHHEAVLPAEVENTILTSEVAAALHRAIDSLPRRQREVVLLRLEGQASYRDIAEKCQISYKTVDVHLQRAFAKLRKILPQLLG